MDKHAESYRSETAVWKYSVLFCGDRGRTSISNEVTT